MESTDRLWKGNKNFRSSHEMKCEHNFFYTRLVRFRLSFAIEDFPSHQEILHSLRYTHMESHLCQGLSSRRDTHDTTHDSNVVVLIKSAVENFDRREFVRSTWGSLENEPKFARVIFFLGETRHKGLQRKIEQEISEKKDIVQYNMIDSYHNLTIKSLAMIKVNISS